MTDYSISGVNPSPAQTQTLQDTLVSQNSTHTIVRFTKALVEHNELTIHGDGVNTFIWAYGSSNELTYHASRGALTLTLVPCHAGESSTLGPSAPTTTFAPVATFPTTGSPSSFSVPTGPEQGPSPSSTDVHDKPSQTGVPHPRERGSSPAFPTKRSKKDAMTAMMMKQHEKEKGKKAKDNDSV